MYQTTQKQNNYTLQLQKRLDEIMKLYNQTMRQADGLSIRVRELERYINRLLDTGDFSIQTPATSNESWCNRAIEMVKELVKINRGKYPTDASVLTDVYRKMRDAYGIVLDQLRKEYRINNDTLRSVSTLEAIADNLSMRDIFDAILLDLFPRDYFNDNILEAANGNMNNNTDCFEDKDKIVALVRGVLESLKIKDNDTMNYISIYSQALNRMPCHWDNLETRYMNKNPNNGKPTKMMLINTNPLVFNKFKSAVKTLFM